MTDWVPLALVRAVHFAAVLQLAGLAVAAVLGIAPLIKGEPALRRLGWAALALAMASGLAWIVLQAAAMSGQSPDAATVAAAATETVFGRSALLRLTALAAAGLLLPASPALAALAGLFAAGSLAWSGHAVAGLGGEAVIHLAGDVAHLLAAAVWLGGLLPLAWTLRRPGADRWRAVRRFSALGLVAVAVLIASGAVNAVFLVGSLAGLLGTAYGHLLLLKLGLFAAMLALAVANRLVLAPRQAADALARNTLAEAALGLMVVAVVAAMGTQPPALHGEVRWPLPWRPDPERPLALIPATPTSFTPAPAPYTAGAVARGQTLYARLCAECHAEPPAPRTEGDAFWWIGHGGPGMPAFADRTDEAERWEMVLYLRARADAGRPLTAEVGGDTAVAAPDLETPDGATLQDLAAEGAVLLVFHDPADAASNGRLTQLETRRPAMEARGASLVMVELGRGGEAAAAYSLFAADLAPHTEFIVDRAGNLRARWQPGDPFDWRAARLLSEQLGRAAQAGRPAGHAGHR